MKRILKSIIISIIRNIKNYLRTDPVEHYRALGAKIGDNVFLGGVGDIKMEEEYAKFVTIEDNVTIAKGTQIIQHDSSMNNLFGLPIKFGKVIIRKNAYIGANCTISCGVEIGEGALIGIGSLVITDIPSNRVAFGVPAKVKGTTFEFRDRFIEKMNDDKRNFYWNIVHWRERKDWPKERIDKSVKDFMDNVDFN